MIVAGLKASSPRWIPALRRVALVKRCLDGLFAQAWSVWCE
jgi:hypothetical protein